MCNEVYRTRQAFVVMAAICLCCGTASAASAAEDVTAFFRDRSKAVDFKATGNRLLLANRHVGLEFRRTDRGFCLTRLYGVAAGVDFLAEGQEKSRPDLIEIVMLMDPSNRHASTPDGATLGPQNIRIGGDRGIIGRVAAGGRAVNLSTAKRMENRHTADAASATLHLEWLGLTAAKVPGMMDARVTVTLKADDPFVYWRFKIDNRDSGYGIERVRFPVLAFAPIGDPADNAYIYPTGRGWLVEDPFTQSWSFGEDTYPGGFSMQFQALYNKRTGAGVYFGTQDPKPCFRLIRTDHDAASLTWGPGHLPPDVGYGLENFELDYDCVVRPFQGDWWDACQIYRQWAIQQRWCRKGPLADRDDIPKWYKEAPLYLMTDSYAKPENVTATRDHYLQFLKWAGVSLPCNWYTWKEYHPQLTTYNVPFIRATGRSTGTRPAAVPH